MNVCIAVAALSTHGGAERVVCEEARYFVEQGCDLTILTTNYDPSIAESYGVPDEVTVVETDGSLVSDVIRTRRLIRNHPIDIFFTHSFTKRLYLATRSPSIQTPYVPHVHGTVLWFTDDPNRLAFEEKPGYEELVSGVPGHRVFYDELEASLAVRLRASASQWLEKRGLQHAAHITTGSKQVQRELQTLYDVNASIVRPGVAESWISEYDAVEGRKLSNHEYTVLSVSRLDPRKRVSLLVKVVAELRKEGYDIGLVVAGTGDERDRLEELAESRGVESAVTFAGYVPESELVSYYKSADVFACPGWMSYGITPIEAYAMRTPVAISSDAFAHEVLGEAPGVEVIAPSVNKWVSKLPTLFNYPTDLLEPTIVPTWGEFCCAMYATAAELSMK